MKQWLFFIPKLMLSGMQFRLSLPFSDEDVFRQCLSDISSNMQECSKAAL